MTVKIEEIEITRNWFTIWLMYVNGVNLSQHCKPCLKGFTSRKVHKNTKCLGNVKLDEAEAKYYYLCGVATPYSWENNFHLAWKEKEGSIIEYESNGISIKLKNAERITFCEDDIDYSLKNAEKREYYTCRNWQFANKISKEMNEDYRRYLKEK